MKVAVIGSGISGLAASYYLQEQHDITLYEANDYLGGHTCTIDIEHDGEKHAIDTGFIVFNDKTYPNFNRFIRDIGADFKNTDMSFSVQNQEINLEYNGSDLNTLFSQRKNFLSPKFYRFLLEIVRFNKMCKKMGEEDHIPNIPLSDFLNQNQFSNFFQFNYIIPMIAAIWSSSYEDSLGFPLPFFIRFFENHGLLNITDRPQWHVIKGGSREYVRALRPKLNIDIHLQEPVVSVCRDHDGVTIISKNKTARYDKVIFACHSDQALKLLSKPSQDEQRVLSRIKYIPNSVILHTDKSRLPKEQRSWACWNYMIPKNMDHESLATVSYNMNLLQGLESKNTFIVSLNQEHLIDKSKILRTFTYDHPLFSLEADAAKKERDLICGQQNTYYCGAYWRNGFHEDGISSALDVVQKLKGVCDAQVASGF